MKKYSLLIALLPFLAHDSYCQEFRKAPEQIVTDLRSKNITEIKPQNDEEPDGASRGSELVPRRALPSGNLFNRPNSNRHIYRNMPGLYRPPYYPANFNERVPPTNVAYAHPHLQSYRRIPLGPNQMAPPFHSILTCQGHRYAIPADVPFYSCCGKQVYYWPNETCHMMVVGSGSSPDPQFQPTQVPGRRPGQFFDQSDIKELAQADGTVISNGETMIKCGPAIYPVPAGFRYHYDCCGQLLYDKRSSACNPSPNSRGERHTKNEGHTIFPMSNLIELAKLIANAADSSQSSTPTKTSTTTTPSTTTIFSIDFKSIDINHNQECPTSHLCCKGYQPMFNANNRFQCCPGAGPYDPDVSACVLP